MVNIEGYYFKSTIFVHKKSLSSFREQVCIFWLKEISIEGISISGGHKSEPIVRLGFSLTVK